MFGQDPDVIQIHKQVDVLGGTKPIPVSLDGFSGEVASVLKFDLYVQGFSFTNADAAQYQISGSNSGNVIGHVSDTVAKKEILSRGYTGASLRRQAHAFADDIVYAITRKRGIAQTKIAFKSQSESGSGEIYVSDFDGGNPQASRTTTPSSPRPRGFPGRLALYYTSYSRATRTFFTMTFRRAATASSRDYRRPEHERGGFAGRHKSGDDFEQGRQPGRLCLRHGRLESETVDRDAGGRIIAVLVAGRAMDLFRDENKRSAACSTKIPAGGGAIQVIHTVGAPNPTEPDWSPDGKWIAFTCAVQRRV